MNIKLIKEKWIKFYKKGFITGLMVLSFICFIDQTLQSPLFFIKIDSFKIFFINLSIIFFGSVFCAIVSIILLIILSLVTVPKK